MSDEPKGLAKVSWTDPETNIRKHFVLTEGAIVSIGRSQNNEICIREQHVSRQHAVIRYQDGVFMISDLGSANKTFVNDQLLTEPFPLMDGDVIRLYVPIVNFSAVVTAEDEENARATGTFIMPSDQTKRPKLIITTGPQEGNEIPLLVDLVRIGRAVATATWEIGLQDPSVSRPHAKIEKLQESWFITDLNSSNGTLLNEAPLTTTQQLADGHVITIGQTKILFRLTG